jgi:hypothetical protein
MWMKVSAENGYKWATAGLPVLRDKMGADELKRGEDLLRSYEARKKGKKSSSNGLIEVRELQASTGKGLLHRIQLSKGFTAAYLA